MRIIRATDLRPGDIVPLKHGAQAVSRIEDCEFHAERIWVWFVGQSYPLCYRRDIEVDVTGHIDLAAVEYAAQELVK